jgi:mRNA interferase HigB
VPFPALARGCGQVAAPGRLAPITGARYTGPVRVIARKALRDFWERHPEAESALRAWYHDVDRAGWTGPDDVRRQYATASFVANNRVVFNVRGNRYRIVVAINYAYGVVYVRFVGTHAEYDRIDAATV